MFGACVWGVGKLLRSCGWVCLIVAVELVALSISNPLVWRSEHFGRECTPGFWITWTSQHDQDRTKFKNSERWLPLMLDVMSECENCETWAKMAWAKWAMLSVTQDHKNQLYRTSPFDARCACVSTQKAKGIVGSSTCSMALRCLSRRQFH